MKLEELRSTPPSNIAAALDDSNQPTWGNVIRRPNGKIYLMDHSDALQYCADYGGYLLNTREWAQRAMTMGAVGIRETAFPKVPVTDPSVEREIKAMEAV